MKSKCAVIPARAGSTRLKHKNILPLAGKPLVCHTIDAVIESGIFDTIIVSTDCPEIKHLVQHLPVRVIDRPASLATEKATVLDAMLDLMEHIEKHDIFAYFLPTCPFRNAKHIQKGMELLNLETDSVISTCHFSEPPQLAMIQSEDNVIPVFDNLVNGLTNSKFITPYVKPNGGFYISWWDHLIKNKNFFTGKIKGYLMSKEDSIDINDAIDLKLAELIMTNLEKVLI